MKTKKALSVLLALLMLLSVCICGASAMVIEKPEGFDAFARLHIPQHLHISVEEIDKIAGFVYGTAKALTATRAKASLREMLGNSSVT